MNLSLERKIQIGFGVAVAIIVVIGAAALQSTTATVDSALWVAHTLEVRGELEATFADLIDVETGVRGYVITGDTTYLTPYQGARATLGGLLARLRTLTADNPAQQRRLDSLETLVSLRLERFRWSIETRRTGGPAAAGRAVIGGRGKELTGLVRGLIRQMEDDEGRLLAQRSATLQSKARLARLAAWGGALVAFALAGVAGVLITSELARRRQAEEALRATQGRFQQVLASSTAVIYANTVAEGAFSPSWVSENVTRITGYETDEALQPTWWLDNLHPDHRPRVLAEIAVLLTNDQLTTEYRFRYKDGSYHWVHDESRLLRDAAGKPVEVFGSWVDITERTRAEEALRGSEERFRNLATTANDAIVSANSRGEITYFNPGAERAFGYAAAEVVGKPIGVLMPERFRAAHRAGLERYLATGEARVVGKTVELAGRRKDGTEFPLDLSLASWTQDQEVGFTAIIRDVTERQRAEQALRVSEERFRLLMGSVRDYAIYMLDPTGRVVSWNRGAEQIKGYTAQEIVGQHFSCFFTPEDVAAGKPDALLRAAAAEGRCEEENWRVRKDGARFWADVVITSVRDEAGTLVGFAKVTRDLTERLRAEAELQTRAAQLEAANKELAPPNSRRRTRSSRRFPIRSRMTSERRCAALTASRRRSRKSMPLAWTRQAATTCAASAPPPSAWPSSSTTC